MLGLGPPPLAQRQPDEDVQRSRLSHPRQRSQRAQQLGRNANQKTLGVLWHNARPAGWSLGLDLHFGHAISSGVN